MSGIHRCFLSFKIFRYSIANEIHYLKINWRRSWNSRKNFAQLIFHNMYIHECKIVIFYKKTYITHRISYASRNLLSGADQCSLHPWRPNFRLIIVFAPHVLVFPQQMQPLIILLISVLFKESQWVWKKSEICHHAFQYETKCKSKNIVNTKKKKKYLYNQDS